ncbi:uncharacterized protein C8R40DRAFT_1106585 [Lentinula edodes]|uniref:uncharacterized protein n=1 Tax=Lentinula edodes TaxID=5353 RepID=UPI001E8DC350|nr:uncharacterized protein C8R40DRAFT_1106585 [Lentinula edodes]KAH7874990.1 hypothetical protein C8R40DRAFT_1106585 [Lentinula edodes]
MNEQIFPWNPCPPELLPRQTTSFPPGPVSPRGRLLHFPIPIPNGKPKITSDGGHYYRLAQYSA